MMCENEKCFTKWAFFYKGRRCFSWERMRRKKNNSQRLIETGWIFLLRNGLSFDFCRNFFNLGRPQKKPIEGFSVSSLVYHPGNHLSGTSPLGHPDVAFAFEFMKRKKKWILKFASFAFKWKERSEVERMIPRLVKESTPIFRFSLFHQVLKHSYVLFWAGNEAVRVSVKTWGLLEIHCLARKAISLNFYTKKKERTNRLRWNLVYCFSGFPSTSAILDALVAEKKPIPQHSASHSWAFFFLFRKERIFFWM